MCWCAEAGRASAGGCCGDSNGDRCGGKLKSDAFASNAKEQSEKQPKKSERKNGTQNRNAKSRRKIERQTRNLKIRTLNRSKAKGGKRKRGPNKRKQSGYFLKKLIIFYMKKWKSKLYKSLEVLFVIKIQSECVQSGCAASRTGEIELTRFS